MKLKLLGIAGLIALIGCVEIKDKDQKKAQAIKSEKVFQMTYQISPLNEPQKYLVRFSGVDCDLKMKRSTAKSVASTELVDCEDVVSEPGNHVYDWLDQGLPKSITVSIPEDRVIEGTVQVSELNFQELNDHNEIKKQVLIPGRLFFRSAARLVTNGESILIEANEIYSEGASIVTFESNSRAESLKAGQGGGLIYLKAKKIQGALRVELRGQHGGHGQTHLLSRTHWRHLNLNGSNGGNSGRLWLQAEDLSHSQIMVTKHPGQPGMGTDVQLCALTIDGKPCTRRILRPKGSDGAWGFEERSCQLENQQCQDLKHQN